MRKIRLWLLRKLAGRDYAIVERPIIRNVYRFPVTTGGFNASTEIDSIEIWSSHGKG